MCAKLWGEKTAGGTAQKPTHGTEDYRREAKPGDEGENSVDL